MSFLKMTSLASFYPSKSQDDKDKEKTNKYTTPFRFFGHGLPRPSASY
jgi:hypothetical protein